MLFLVDNFIKKYSKLRSNEHYCLRNYVSINQITFADFVRTVPIRTLILAFWPDHSIPSRFLQLQSGLFGFSLKSQTHITL